VTLAATATKPERSKPAKRASPKEATAKNTKLTVRLEQRLASNLDTRPRRSARALKTSGSPDQTSA
jgi:hypothetical protein